MKKAFLTILFATACFCATLASPVSSSTAAQTARTFFSSSSVSPALPEIQTKAESDAPAYYIFNNPSGGWAIIAGDDCCEPVLAYSASGSFDYTKLPPNFTVWMEGISTNVEAVRKAGLTPSASIKAKWKSTGVKTKSSTVQNLLETANWNQGSPYNSKCPPLKKELCATGCVATAMAIVLRLNKYPEKGTGTIPAYTTDSKKISVPAITLGITYDWNNMPLEYGSSATTAQKNAVANLMYHCGAMVQMDYTPEGSGAYSTDIIPALTKYMGYSKAARELYRTNYSNPDWFNIIKGEIDAGRAIIYGGSNGYGNDGHQFVLDGYNSDCMVHVNWGWGGVCNAWYAINYLGDRTEQGVAGVFSYSDSAIIGLAPETGPSTQNVELNLESSENTLNGISLKSGKIVKGGSFSLTVGFICNYDLNYDYNGALKVGLYDRNGKLKEYVSEEQSLNIGKASISGQYLEPGYTSMIVSCSIAGDISLGDYLMLVYKLSDGSWVTLGGYNTDEYTAASDKWFTLYKLGVMDLAMLNVPDAVSAGQVLYFDMVGSHKLPSSISWYWDNTQNTLRHVKATAGSHTLKAVINYTDGSVETVQKVINVQ